ncbi:unnamed protein product [Amaranthus hypochondriacus]
MDVIRRFYTRGDHRNRSTYRICFCFRLMFRLKLAEPPQEIVDLFNDYSKNGVMTVENLQEFLREFQEEQNYVEKAESIFNSLKHLHVFQRSGLHLHAFFKYLTGDLNSPLAHQGEVHHDMNKPLSHYFLYTGHNSYLTGNQLMSDSSIEPIIRALRSGVRVIELDLWPSRKNKHDIEVRHGGTMTSSVKLIKCLEAIKDHAFAASKYPVIITFEDHLSPRRQKIAAQMVSNTFGEMLHPGEDFVEFPSPEKLKEKIVISTKPPKESSESFNDQQSYDHKTKEFSDRSQPIQENYSGTPYTDPEFDIPIKVSLQDDEEEEEEDEEGSVPEYRNLIAIHALKWQDGGFEHLLKQNSNRAARLSMSEQELEDTVKSHATDIVKFTQKNILRVYPKGTRVWSSNYNPLIGWTHGAQMVALNMQGYEKHLWIMQGMFRANGGCGYVKKPDFLLRNEPFDPKIRTPIKKILKVKLYMGDGWHMQFRRTHFDPFSPPDFFAKVEIWGVRADIKRETTTVIEDQWVPMWNKEFKFPLTAPELALLRIEVRDDDVDGRHGFAGQTCLPVSELKTGIRAIPLYSQKGEKYEHVKLLIKFQISLP